MVHVSVRGARVKSASIRHIPTYLIHPDRIQGSLAAKLVLVLRKTGEAMTLTELQAATGAEPAKVKGSVNILCRDGGAVRVLSRGPVRYAALGCRGRSLALRTPSAS